MFDPECRVGCVYMREEGTALVKSGPIKEQDLYGVNVQEPLWSYVSRDLSLDKVQGGVPIKPYNLLCVSLRPLEVRHKQITLLCCLF